MFMYSIPAIPSLVRAPSRPPLLGGLIEKSKMKGQLTKVWSELREPNRDDEALRIYKKKEQSQVWQHMPGILVGLKV